MAGRQKTAHGILGRSRDFRIKQCRKFVPVVRRPEEYGDSAALHLGKNLHQIVVGVSAYRVRKGRYNMGRRKDIFRLGKAVNLFVPLPVGIKNMHRCFCLCDRFVNMEFRCRLRQHGHTLHEPHHKAVRACGPGCADNAAPQIAPVPGYFHGTFLFPQHLVGGAHHLQRQIRHSGHVFVIGQHRCHFRLFPQVQVRPIEEYEGTHGFLGSGQLLQDRLWPKPPIKKTGTEFVPSV